MKLKTRIVAALAVPLLLAACSNRIEDDGVLPDTAVDAGTIPETDAGIDPPDTKPTAFTADMIEGKTFHSVLFEDDGVTVHDYVTLSFSGSSFTFRNDIFGEEGTGAFQIENGFIVLQSSPATRIALRDHSESKWRVEFDAPDGKYEADWYLAQADADAAMSKVRMLPNASISVDGTFADWETVPRIESPGTSPVIDLLAVRFAKDDTYLYFHIEADKPLADFLPGQDDKGWSHILWINFNGVDNGEVGTADGNPANAWLGDGGAGSFASGGGQFAIAGNQMEGRIPLSLFTATYASMSVEFGVDDPNGADEGADDYTIENVHPLFRR